MKYKIVNKQYLKCCAVVAVSASLSASELTVDFTNDAELAAPIAGKVKFTGSSASDVCTFSGSATGDVQVTLGKVAMSSGTPIASGKAIRLNGGDLIATAGFSLPSVVMVQDGSLDTQNHSVDLNALSGSGELTVIGDGNNVVNVKSDLSASTLGGINVDNGNFYVNAGRTPNGPLKIAGGAQLQLAGDHNATASQVTGSLTVDAGGTIVVNAGKKVGAVLSQTLTYSWNRNTGYFEFGAMKLSRPSNLLSYWLSYDGADGHWNTNDTTDQGIYYGGVRLVFRTAGPNPNSSTPFMYRVWTSAMEGQSPQQVTPSDNDVALTGPVSMQAGSKIQLGAGATWARNVTVTA
jgi:hypothetical protein